MESQRDEVEAVEIDHCHDFDAEYVSPVLKSRSTQTLGLDEDFLSHKPAIKTENILVDDGYSYAHSWHHAPSMVVPTSTIHNSEISHTTPHNNEISHTTPPISPDSTTPFTGVQKTMVISHDLQQQQQQQQWMPNNPAYVMLVQQSLAAPHPTPAVGSPTVSSTVQDGVLNYSEKVYPKPVYSYSCLITMALKNSKDNKLPVSEIYHYMQTQFPYFRLAPEGWKNSVRHNLSLNKAFYKLDRADRGGTAFSPNKKGCYWLLNPEKLPAMDNEIIKWKRKHPEAIQSSMLNPDDFWDPPNHGIGQPPAHVYKKLQRYQPYTYSKERVSLNQTILPFDKENTPLFSGDEEDPSRGTIRQMWGDVGAQDSALFSDRAETADSSSSGLVSH